jgi:hypothetical protein
LPLSDQDVETDILAEMNNIYPIGYPTEQFISDLKNDIIWTFNKLKEDRKKAVLEMRRAMFEDTAKMKVEKPPEIQRDPGLLDAKGESFERFFPLHDSQSKVQIATLLKVEDKIYNQMRSLFKEQSTLNIRPYFKHPTKSYRKAQQLQKNFGSNDVVSQFNEVGFNPALERRLLYKNVSC